MSNLGPAVRHTTGPSWHASCSWRCTVNHSKGRFSKLGYSRDVGSADVLRTTGLCSWVMGDGRHPEAGGEDLVSWKVMSTNKGVSCYNSRVNSVNCL